MPRLRRHAEQPRARPRAARKGAHRERCATIRPPPTPPPTSRGGIIVRLNSPPLTERNPCPPAEQSALEAARAEVIEVEVATEVALVDIVAITGDVAEVAACIMSRTMESNFRYEGERRTPT